MRQPSPIADYLDALAAELSFDTALARRVRAEAEDHLVEATGDADGETTADRERRAIAKFGAPPRALARQFAAISLLAQLRGSAIGLVLALTGIFLAMEARVVWYASMHWEFARYASASAIGLSIDRAALILALASVLIGCAAVVACRAPAEFHAAYGKALRRRLLVCSAAGTAMAVAVATETVLTTLRLVGIGFSPSILVPALLLAAEIATLGLLIRQLFGLRRRLATATALFGDAI